MTAGALGGVADELQQQGKDASLEGAANRAISGAVAGLATGGLNKKIGNATSKAGAALLNNKLATSAIGRGALSGAVGGSVGAGTSAALAGQDVTSAALQGGLTGAMGGAAQAGIVSGARRLADKAYSGVVNKNAVERLAKGIEQGADGNIKFARMNKGVFDEINSIRTQNGLEPLTQRQVTAYRNAVNNNLGNRVNEGLNASEVAQIAFNSLTSDSATAIPGYYENQIAISSPGLKNDFDSSVIGLAQDGGTSLKSIEPRTRNQITLFESQGQQKSGPKTNSGFSLADSSQPTSNLSVSQNPKNVNQDVFAHNLCNIKGRFYTYINTT